MLYAVHGYKPAYRIGGPIHSVSAAAERLVRRGHHISVFTTNSNLDEDLDVPLDRPVDVDGVQVWYFRREEYLKRWLPSVSYLSRSLGFLYAPQMAAQLERMVPGVDLVHTHMPFVYPTYAAAHAARRFRKPLFYHQRGVFDPNRLRFRSLKKRLYIAVVERSLARQATTLIALTEAEVASYRALGMKTPCRIIPNGIAVPEYLERCSLPSGSRWNVIPADKVVILFLGRLHPIKGAEKLLQAFLRLGRERPHTVLIMAGPDEWGLRTRFREMIGQAGMGERVVFPGMVSGMDKTELLARADLFCLPSTGEGFSMAVLEAMASATPVLLSPGCNFPEVEAAGVGRVVQPEPEALADELANLLAEPGNLRAMGARARDFVARHYSWDRIIDQLLDAYAEGIERNTKRRNG
jgi:glycosyltransferase involved in cell wall biosynthesis